MTLNALDFPSSFPAIVLVPPIVWPREQAAAWRVGRRHDVTGAFFSWAAMGGNNSVAGKPANDFFQSRWDRCPPCSTSLRSLEITNQALPNCISTCTCVHTYIHTHIYSCAFIQLILIHRFHICEFPHVPEFLRDPPNRYSATSRPSVKKLSLPAEADRGVPAF